jgi:phosphoribosylamine--glycine ligase
LIWKFSKSKRVTGLYAIPGNAGTAELAENVAINPEDGASVAAFAREKGLDFVFIGPEQPLAAGVADELRAAGILTFGPGKKSAELESSKAFARDFAERQGIPCAKSATFGPGEEKAFTAYVKKWDKEKGKAQAEKVVIKKSGLAAGKGVFEATGAKEALEFGLSVLASDQVVVEEFLTGWELSLFALCDENNYLTLLPCADHKKAGENDTGLNTGGMGAICPVPPAGPDVLEEIDRTIVKPTFDGMKKEGLAYRGVLFFGVMVTAQGPKLLEYNVRFGDPETQSLLPLIETDFLDVAEKTARGELAGVEIAYAKKCAVGVVVAAPGYPGSYPKDLPVEDIHVSDIGDAVVFHANTSFRSLGESGKAEGIATGGGRCFTAVATGSSFQAASANAYAAARRVRFEGAWFRPDIGKRLASILMQG